MLVEREGIKRSVNDVKGQGWDEVLVRLYYD